MIESEFIALADRVLEAIGEALDASDADLDWRIDDGILEIDCAGSAGRRQDHRQPSRAQSRAVARDEERRLPLSARRRRIREYARRR